MHGLSRAGSRIVLTAVLVCTWTRVGRTEVQVDISDLALSEQRALAASVADAIVEGTIASVRDTSLLVRIGADGHRIVSHETHIAIEPRQWLKGKPSSVPLGPIYALVGRRSELPPDVMGRHSGRAKRLFYLKRRIHQAAGTPDPIVSDIDWVLLAGQLPFAMGLAASGDSALNSERLATVAIINKQLPELLARQADVIVIGRPTGNAATCGDAATQVCVELAVDTSIIGTANRKLNIIFEHFPIPESPSVYFLKRAGSRYRVLQYRAGITPFDSTTGQTLNQWRAKTVAQIRAARNVHE